MQMRWYERQLEVGRSLVQQGSQALRQGDFGTANAAFAEASAILDMAEEDTLDIRKLRAQVMNETGFILQRAGQADLALANHRRAAEICNDLNEAGEDFRGNAAATNINLATLLASKGLVEEATAAAELALSNAESIAADGDDATATNLLFGANQTLAMVRARAENWESADEAMSTSMALVDQLAQGNGNVLAQAAQSCQQLSVILFHNEQFELALKYGRQAEELSEKAYQTLGDSVLGVYVTSQVNLISFYEKQDLFGDAESALFKALEVVGDHPQILLRGHAFYQQCRKLADSKLEAGNLPREEVDEGIAEIEERIEAAGGLDKITALVRAELGESDEEE